MERFSRAAITGLQMMFRNLRWALAPVAILAGGLVLVSEASADVTNTVLTGSSGNFTLSLKSIVFNNDPAAIGGGNSDVASGTNLTFEGCPTGVLGSPGCLSAQEGVTVNNADLTSTPPSASNANTFLTFAAHPNLVFSASTLGPGSPNTNCATANGNGLSCSIFAGSSIILTYANGDTFLSFGVSGKASDTGVGGLARGSDYKGGFSDFFSSLLPNGTAPTPQNIQLYFCPGVVCTAADFTSTKSITSSQSGSFTADDSSHIPPVPEPSSLLLSALGSITLLLVGTGLLKFSGCRA